MLIYCLRIERDKPWFITQVMGKYPKKRNILIQIERYMIFFTKFDLIFALYNNTNMTAYLEQFRAAYSQIRTTLQMVEQTKDIKKVISI